MRNKTLIAGLQALIFAVSAMAALAQDREMWEEPSHQLVFSQNGTRVLDVRIVAGLISEYHSHRFATLYVVIQDAKIKSQRQAADWFDLSDRERNPSGTVNDRSDYYAKPYVHRVENVDDRALHLVAIVNERDLVGDTEIVLTEAGKRVDNAWFREHRIALGPGEASQIIRLPGESVLVQYDGGVGHVLENGVSHSVGTAPGAFSWHAADAGFQVVNDSNTAREYVLIELKAIQESQ